MPAASLLTLEMKFHAMIDPLIDPLGVNFMFIKHLLGTTIFNKLRSRISPISSTVWPHPVKPKEGVPVLITFGETCNHGL